MLGYHDALIRNFFYKGVSNFLNNERFVFAKTS